MSPTPQCSPEFSLQPVYTTHSLEESSSKRTRIQPPALDRRREPSPTVEAETDSEDDSLAISDSNSYTHSKLYLGMNTLLRDLHSESSLRHSSHLIQRGLNQHRMDEKNPRSCSTQLDAPVYEHSNRYVFHCGLHPPSVCSMRPLLK